MKLNIISQTEAIKRGLSKPSGGGTDEHLVGVVGIKGKNGAPDKIVERYKLDTKTKKKDILYEDKKWKEKKIKEKINEYKNT
jgi:hypothetical protein